MQEPTIVLHSLFIFLGVYIHDVCRVCVCVFSVCVCVYSVCVCFFSLLSLIPTHTPTPTSTEREREEEEGIYVVDKSCIIIFILCLINSHIK